MSGPQAEPSAAGINLVSHFLPTRWHHRALQISWMREEGEGKTALVGPADGALFWFIANLKGGADWYLTTAANKN